MVRFTVLVSLTALLFPSLALGGETEDRVERLEQEIRQLRQRIKELETPAPAAGSEDSELARLLADAEAEAASAEEEAGGPAGLVTGSTQTRLNAFNPRITAFGDFVGRLDSRAVEAHDARRADDRASLRSVEMDLRADVDPFAKAVAILGLHEHEPGSYELDPEEVYVTLETLPLGLRAKIGKFLASMGVLNRLHPHDYPQATAPLVSHEFLGEEGMNDAGGELSVLVPQDLADSVELTFGLYDGGLDYLAGSESQDPAFLGRAQIFETLSDSTFLQVGTSHLFGYTDAAAEHPAWLAGLDLMARWRPPQRAIETSLFAQLEIFHSRRETDEGTTNSLGGYALLQYQPIRDVYVGVRYDRQEPLDRFSGEGRSWAGGLWLSYYTSEFLRFRLGYEHRGIEHEPDLETLWFEVTFVFGSHPVEPYWFNK